MQKILNHIISVGCTKEMHTLERGNIKAINIFSLFSVISTVPYIFLGYFSNISELIICICLVMLIGSFYLLNLLGKVNLCKNLFHIITPIILALIMVVFGPQHSDELGFFMCVILGFISYQDKIKKFTIVAWNFFCCTFSLMINNIYGPISAQNISNIDTFNSAILTLIMTTILLKFIVDVNDQRSKEVLEQKEQSENLLHNILPKIIADEIKEKGNSEATMFENTTVMFTDFVGFTQKSKQLSPSVLVDTLHEIFTNFDNIISNYNIEKIKTIGDAYLAVSGLPKSNNQHAEDIVAASLDIIKYIEYYKEKQKNLGLPYFDIRIGVHTGPIVAGIVGIKKYQYDIWGATVNIANLLEEKGEAGKVNISDSTFALIKNKFTCKFKKQITLSDNTKTNMYYIENHLVLKPLKALG